MKMKSKLNLRKDVKEGKKTTNSIEHDRKISATTGKFERLFSWDVGLSQRFASFMQTRFPTVTYMFENRFMEISGNEYIVFPALAVLYFMHPFVHKQLPINLALALAFDSAVILLIKALVRRRRPTAKNPDYFTAIGPDEYSFPSASSLIWSWSISVCLSRMLNGRHYLFDVSTGAAIGVCEGSFIVSYFWMSPEQAEGIFRFLSLGNASTD